MGVEVWIYSFLTSVLGVDEWLATHTGRISTVNHWIVDFVGPRTSLVRFNKINLLSHSI